MRRRTIKFLRVLALCLTALFLLSTVFSFGVSTHWDPSLSWNASSTGVGILQVYCGAGQFHLLADFAPPTDARSAARVYCAGASVSPELRFDLRKSDRFISKLGIDAFAIQGGTYLSCGTVGLYPAALAWILLWIVSRRRAPGTCSRCGYDLRQVVERCPECGTPIPRTA